MYNFICCETDITNRRIIKKKKKGHMGEWDTHPRRDHASDPDGYKFESSLELCGNPRATAIYKILY